MAVLTAVPENAHRGFIELNRMSDSTFNELNESIAKIPIYLGITKVAETISPFIADISPENTKKILLSIGGLIMLRYRNMESSQSIINELIKVIKESGIEGLKLENNDAEKRFSERVAILTENEKLFYCVKSYDLFTEHKNLFTSAQIITDIRPIFSSEPDKKANVGMATMVLKIHYHSGENHEDIFIAIDNDDLKSLEKIVSETKIRMKHLEVIMDQSGLTQVKID